MNAADSCFHNGGKLQETEPYIFCCINFGDSVSTVRKDGRQREALGGSERSRGWEPKRRDIRPCRLDILTPAEK